jgi:hypothetical protein
MSSGKFPGWQRTLLPRRACVRIQMVYLLYRFNVLKPFSKLAETVFVPFEYRLASPCPRFRLPRGRFNGGPRPKPGLDFDAARNVVQISVAPPTRTPLFFFVFFSVRVPTTGFRGPARRGIRPSPGAPFGEVPRRESFIYIRYGRFASGALSYRRLPGGRTLRGRPQSFSLPGSGLRFDVGMMWNGYQQGRAG